MSLTLTCVCPGAIGACLLSAMTWEVNAISGFNNGGTSGITLTTYVLTGTHGGGTPFSETVSSPGTYSFSLPLDIDWSSLKVTLTIDATLFQPVANAGSVWACGDYILQDYVCVDNTGSHHYFKRSTHTTDMSTNCTTGPGDIRSICIMGFGGGQGDLFKSTPLGACNGCSAFSDIFDNPPNTDIVNISYGGACLCGSGGTPPYTYSVASGVLPSGLTLNSSTGCISGTQTDITDVSDITFQVIDSTGASASIVCSTIPSATGTCPLTVNCPASDAQSGEAYDSFIIACGGVSPYTFSISSGSLPTGLTLNTSTGEITGSPSSAGTTSFSVTVTDSASNTATASCSITAASPGAAVVRYMY